MDAEDTSKRVVDLVGQWWEHRGAPMLLSALGAMEEGAVATTARDVSGSLRMFIQQRLSNDIVVVQHQRRPTIVGAVPRAAYNTHEDWDALLDKVTNSSGPQHRYHPAFWAAFRKPIAESDTRYLTTSGPVRFTDLRHGSPPEHTVEIQRELIAVPQATDADVHENIGIWLSVGQRMISMSASSELPKRCPRTAKGGSSAGEALSSNQRRQKTGSRLLGTTAARPVAIGTAT